MDPEEAYRQLKELSADMHGWQDRNEDPDEPGEYYRIAADMVEHFDALDGWLSRGGFLPAPWRKWREEAKASADAAGDVRTDWPATARKLMEPGGPRQILEETGFAPIEGADAPNKMVDRVNNAFFPDSLEDAQRFAAWHSAKPVHPDRFPFELQAQLDVGMIRHFEEVDGVAYPVPATIDGVDVVTAGWKLERDHEPSGRERVTFTNGTADPISIGDKVVPPGETVELHGATDAPPE